MTLNFLATLMLVVLTFAAPLRADTLPALFRVEGVAADDVLNIRAEPGAGAAILGTMAPGTAGVEVIRLSENGKWGQIGAAEGNGWVAMRYLRPLPAAPRAAPRPFQCHGTEPFWSLNTGAGIGTKTGIWATPDDEPRAMTVVSLLDLSEPRLATQTEGAGWFVSLIGKTANGAPEVFSLTISRETCSDGMSDRIFGFSALVTQQRPGAAQTYSGCCSLDQR